ncbi:hypothetical protein JOD20_003293 [Herpetosiphon giganteus]|nr:hypothetical protein [Herpetosiphon giganteus]
MIDGGNSCWLPPSTCEASENRLIQNDYEQQVLMRAGLQCFCEDA